MPQPPCRDWTRTGSCRFGARCRFSHAGPPGTSTGPVGQSVSGSSNRYGGRQDEYMGYAAAPSKGKGPYGRSQGMDARSVKRMIETDIREEMPLWPLTSYAYEKEGPNIITGDISFEEARAWQYEHAVRSGRPPCMIPELVQEFQESVSKKQALMHRLKTLPLKLLQDLVDNKAPLDESFLQAHPPQQRAPHSTYSKRFDTQPSGPFSGGSSQATMQAPSGFPSGSGQGPGFASGAQVPGMHAFGGNMMYSQQSQFHGGMAGTPQQSFGGSGTVTAPTSQFPTGATGFQQPLQFPSHPIPQAVHSPLGAASGAFPQTFQPFQGFGGSSQFAQGNVEMNTNSSAGQANPIPQAGPGLGFPQPGGPSGFPATSGGGSFVHTPPIPQQGAVQAVGQGTLPNMGNQFQTLPGGFGGHPAQQPHAGANAGNGAQYQQQGFLSNTLQGAPQSVQGEGGQNSNEQAWQKDKFESGNVPDGPPGSLYCK